MRYFSILLAALFLAPAAWSATWEHCISGAAKTQVYTMNVICSDLASGDLTTTVLDVRKCENFDILYDPDTSGTGTAISVTAYNCTSNTASTNSCAPIAGLTLTGVPPSTEIYGAAGGWIYFVGTGTIGSETPRILVHCNP